MFHCTALTKIRTDLKKCFFIYTPTKFCNLVEAYCVDAIQILCI